MPDIVRSTLGHLVTASFGGLFAMALVWAVCRVLRRVPASIRCWGWWLACLKLILGLVSLPDLDLPVVPTAAIGSQAVVPHELRPAAIQPAPVNSAASEADDASATPVSNSPADESSWRSYVLCLIAGAWLLGIGVGIGVQVMALLQLRRLTSGSAPFDSPLVAEAALRSGLRRAPRLYVSSAAIEPLVVANGRHPLILVAGQDLARLGPDEQLALFTHECVHIRRGDLWLSVVPWLAGALFWFLPPVYAALREFQLAREAACDQDTVAALALKPRAYAELLVKLSSLSPLAVPSTVMGLSAGFRGLKRRIEMLDNVTARRSSPELFALATIAGVSVLLPWRLTANAAELRGIPPLDPKDSVTAGFPNLGFSGVAGPWMRTAMGSYTDVHPFFAIGVDPSVTHDGHPSAFVRSRATDYADPTGDGGVLRYDLESADVPKYAGKRVRLSAFVRGDGLTKQAFLFMWASTSEQIQFGKSLTLTPASAKGGWHHLACVMDIPTSTDALSLGLRLEGKGTAYGSGFRVEVVKKSVPTTAVEVMDENAPMQNLTFEDGLTDWWNDNPTHNAESEYTMAFAANGGRAGAPAASLENIVPKPLSYGTIAQNAAPAALRGKRVRFSAYIKTQGADKAELWIVVHDKTPDNTIALNADTTGKILRGTQSWTKVQYTIDIPETTNLLSFGVSSTGKGKIWVDGFRFDVIGPVK